MGAKMSIKHPIIAITGSSGAGTTSVKMTFEQIFRREKISPVYIEGDAFHRWNRVEMREQMKEAGRRGDNHYSHFGPQANLFEELERRSPPIPKAAAGARAPTFTTRLRPSQHNCPTGTFTPWREFEAGSDLLFYEGLHGALVTDEVNVAQYVDLKIGVVPVINLEWIQKLHRDKASRGYTTEAVTDTILRRMPEYINYICPQFTETDINFQRVPTVDTSNPFIARWIPTPDESMVVIRFRDPHGIHFPYLLSMIHGSFMSRAELDRDPGREARHRNAADPHADDPETG